MSIYYKRNRGKPRSKQFKKRIQSNPQHLKDDVDSIFTFHPRGKPCYVWFTQQNGECVSCIYERINVPYGKFTEHYDGQYSVIQTAFSPFLTIGKGTLIKATLCTVNKKKIIIPRDIIWMKGNFVFSHSFLSNLYTFAKYIDASKQKELYKTFTPILLPLMMPSCWFYDKQLGQDKMKSIEYLDSLYPIYDVIRYSTLDNISSGNRKEWSVFRKEIEQSIPWKKIFRVQIGNYHDAYYLNDKDKSFEIVVTNIQDSRKMNRWFNRTFGVDCLDDIEESEQDENENDEYQERIIEFEKQGKQWRPVRLII